jgi:hypothetical protein
MGIIRSTQMRSEIWWCFWITKFFSIRCWGSITQCTTCNDGQDSVNPRTHTDVMTLAHEEDPKAHSYWYARVLGIFHAEISHCGPLLKSTAPKQMDFLWVRWFGTEVTYCAGWKAQWLPCISFVDDLDAAFGFLDPNKVLRAAHLIPGFAHGHMQVLGPSIARPLSDNHFNWTYFYVNMYVFRNLIFRKLTN